MTDSKYESPKKNVNARAAFYKKPIKKNNCRLDSDEDTPQEIRRKLLLQLQKKKRDNYFNNARGLIEEVLINYQDDADDEEEEEMETESQYKNTRNRRYRKNNLMLSEWMLEIPTDFIHKWTMVPCPVGRRTLLVANKGITKAYNKRGRRITKFHSALPGGNIHDFHHKFTLVDCIWQPDEKVYYALDVLAWSNQGFIHCDADCRLYWIQSKLNESEVYREKNSNNEFPIIPLPNIHCSENLSEFLGSLVNFSKLDGLLFFHREGYYNRGKTPLVTWLKPYMLSEVLGIFVPDEFEIKPDDYIDAKHFFATKSRRKKKTSTNLAMDFDTIDNSTVM